MAVPNKNLKAVMEHLVLSNIELAKATSLDPSLVSRYLSGNRQLKAASSQIDTIADFILARGKRVQDIEWLKAQFSDAGLPTDMTTVYRIKQNLILWLATDGEILSRSLGAASSASIAKTVRKTAQTIFAAGSGAKHGCLELRFAIEPALSVLQPGTEVEIFLSNDRIRTITDVDVSSLMLKMIAQRDLRIRMIVCVSGDTQAMSRILDAYMEPLVSGHVQLSVVHGLTQTVTNQLYMILSASHAVLITETVDTKAPPVAVFLTEPEFIAGMRSSFDTTARYSQPILNIYGDDYSRNILEIIYMEFCTPGALDVVKDSINPMYMTPEGYERFLRTRGHNADEYAWRSSEFLRFKTGLDKTLHSGAVFREILSLSRLNDIAETGDCRMSGLYFIQSGYVNLDTEGCLDILNGYIRYLETMPNFHLLIVDALDKINVNNCWQLKQNRHLAVNCWSGPEPTMLYSDQLILLREFQKHFDELWERGQNAIGSRANVISILRDVAGRLEGGNIFM